MKNRRNGGCKEEDRENMRMEEMKERKNGRL
jgi:hypothetical protein